MSNTDFTEVKELVNRVLGDPASYDFILNNMLAWLISEIDVAQAKHFMPFGIGIRLKFDVQNPLNCRQWIQNSKFHIQNYKDDYVQKSKEYLLACNFPIVLIQIVFAYCHYY